MKKESTIGLTYILKSFSFALAQQQAARTVCRLSPVSLFGSNQAQKEQEGKEFTKVDKSAHSFFFFFTGFLLLHVEEIDVEITFLAVVMCIIISTILFI